MTGIRRLTILVYQQVLPLHGNDHRYLLNYPLQKRHTRKLDSRRLGQTIPAINTTQLPSLRHQLRLYQAHSPMLLYLIYRISSFQKPRSPRSREAQLDPVQLRADHRDTNMANHLPRRKICTHRLKALRPFARRPLDHMPRLRPL